MSESQNPGPDSSPNASPNASLDELVRRIKAFTDQVTVARVPKIRKKLVPKPTQTRNQPLARNHGLNPAQKFARNRTRNLAQHIARNSIRTSKLLTLSTKLPITARNQRRITAPSSDPKLANLTSILIPIPGRPIGPHQCLSDRS